MAVGYKKPPLHTRFQKGKSGNPGGRSSAQVKASKQASIARDLLIAKLIDASNDSAAKKSVDEIMSDVRVAMLSFGVPVDKSIASVAVDYFGGMAELQNWATRVLSSEMLSLGLAPEKIKARQKIESPARYRILENAGFKCQACGAKPNRSNDVTLHVDHIIPVSLGGTNSMKNLQCLCEQCNTSKGNRSVYNHNDGWREH